MGACAFRKDEDVGWMLALTDGHCSRAYSEYRRASICPVDEDSAGESHYKRLLVMKRRAHNWIESYYTKTTPQVDVFELSQFFSCSNTRHSQSLIWLPNTGTCS
jgi:hypothetical protein